MDSFIRESIKNGKNAQDILDMPYTFVLDIFAEQAKPKEEQSLIAAFGG